MQFTKCTYLKEFEKKCCIPTDQFSQRNVNDAKRVFEEETIAYQLQQLANDQEYDQSIFDGVMEDYSGKIGYSGEILQAKLEILQSKTQASIIEGTIKPDLVGPDSAGPTGIKGRLAFIEISIILHKTYNIQRLLNSNAHN